METVLVIAYLLGGQVIDTEVLDAANMEQCEATKHNALTGTTPVTTRYGNNVTISAACQYRDRTAGLKIPHSHM